MLGRGHLSILRQGHGSWPDRENFVSTSVTGREDMILMDGQLERDSLLEFYPKSRPQKYFSPPKRPWDLSRISQPKRLWDFSPPSGKERLLVNTRSTRRTHGPREHCCGSFDGARSMGGISNHLSTVHLCTMGRAENGDNAGRRPPHSESRSHADPANYNVKQSFWPTQNEAPSVEPAKIQDHYLLSNFDYDRVSSFKKAGTEQQSNPSQLSAKVGVKIQEIERLKAQMALLCEKLAWHDLRCSKGPCTADEVNSFDSEESLLLKGIGELKKVLSVPTGSSAESRREQGKAFEAEHPDGQEVMEEICRCRNLAWNSGIGTLFQALLWCICLMMTIVRCNSVPELLPT